jgi:DNA-binding MarR family transcriptional regulator
VPHPPKRTEGLRKSRSTKLYRSLTRTLRVYNRLLVERLRARGFDDFSPAFPSLLSNLDADGTRIGVLAGRAGVTRQAAGQLLREIERCGYVKRWDSPTDARATVIAFTPRGKRLLATVLELVEQIEGHFATPCFKSRIGWIPEAPSGLAIDRDARNARAGVLEGIRRLKRVFVWRPASRRQPSPASSWRC